MLECRPNFDERRLTSSNRLPEFAGELFERRAPLASRRRPKDEAKTLAGEAVDDPAKIPARGQGVQPCQGRRALARHVSAVPTQEA